MRDESHLGRWLKRLGGQSDGEGTPPFPQPLELALAAREDRTPRRVALKPGQAFSHFHIQKEVGRGAMAAVYQAVDDRDGRVVALKVLSLGEDWPEDRLEEARLRLFREAEAAGRLQHPDIVRVYEAGDVDGLVFLAMEFVEGVNLGHHSEAGRLLPPRMVTEMCARVADAVHFAHQHGIVHRDIKPANIVFDRNQRRVRVMDFGVARFEESHATRTGIILGSPSYMAPEQLDGRRVTASSDLFSLGVTWFQLLTGMLPFRSDSITGLMQKITIDPAPPLRTVRPDLPECVQRVLDRSLEKDPSRRFTTGAEMAIALRDCARMIPPGLL